jgi:DNA-binding transcriptional ArsR family regulator
VELYYSTRILKGWQFIATYLHFYKNRYTVNMDTLAIIKALSNETRFNILEWLKEPDIHFGPQSHMPVTCDFEGGICVGSIAEKAGLAQSVISSYLVKMQKSGLLESIRHCQWTYYRRNEEGIQQFKDYIQKDL